MPGITDPLTYVLGTIAIVLLPGPNSIFVLTTAARSGVRAGYRAACGVFLGDWVLATAAALGAASLLRANPAVFTAVKYAGAAYLGWIGFGLIRAAVRRWRGRGVEELPSSEPVAGGAAAAVPAGVAAVPAVEVAAAEVTRPFRRAFTVSLLNPKAILFIISFFVQFVDPAYPHPLVPFAILALILEVLSFAYLTTLILAGNVLARQFRRRRRLSSVLSGTVAAVFIGFGIKLATTSLS